MEDNEITEIIIGAAIEVHRVLGPGLLESTHEICVAHEIKQRSTLDVERQKALPIQYMGIELSDGYRLDLLVANRVIVEAKAVEKLLPIHEAQLLTYLRLTGLRVGLLINFNVPVLKYGLKRLVNG